MPDTMTFKIVSKASGKVMDVSASTDASPQVRQFQDKEAVGQLWKVFIPTGLSGFVIRSVATTRFIGAPALLNVFQGSLEDGAPIIWFHPTGSLNEQWRFINSPLEGDTSLCHIVSLASGKRLDVDGLSLRDGAIIVQFGPPQVPLQLQTQLWKFVLAGISSGRHQGVKSQLTRLVLSVLDASLEDGAPIIQSENRGDPNQRWNFETLGSGGFFKIRSSASGKVLDISGGSLVDGAPIVQFEDNGSPSQQWQLVAEAPLNDNLPVFKFMNRSSGKVLSLAPGASSENIVQKSLQSSFSLGDLQWTLFEHPIQEGVSIPKWFAFFQVTSGDGAIPSARQLGLKAHFFLHHIPRQLGGTDGLIDSFEPPRGTLVEKGSTVTMHQTTDDLPPGSQPFTSESFVE